MGFRFYKSLRILPGVRLNISKSGISTSIGVPGANMNVGPRGRRYTAGLPGTGISYVRTASRRRRSGSGFGGARRLSSRTGIWMLVLGLVLVLLLAFLS